MIFDTQGDASFRKTWLAICGKIEPRTDAFFVSERRGPLSRKTARLEIRNYDELPVFALPAHPPQLLHACDFASAGQGTAISANFHLHGSQLGRV